MRIAIDLQSCQSGSRLGGIGRYSTELAKAMIGEHSDRHEFWLILNSSYPAAEAEVRHEFSALLPPDRIRVFEHFSEVAHAAAPTAKIRLAELARETFIAELRPDVLHISSLIEGLNEDVITSVGRLYPADRTAVTLYDLIPLVQEDRYLAQKQARTHYMEKIAHLQRAGLLLSISEFSRTEALQVLEPGAREIVNISSAADSRFQPMTVPADKAAEIRKRCGISRDFLMYTGSFDVRKNHSSLIKSFALLPQNVRSRYQLLIVGNGWDGVYQQLRNVAREAGLENDDLVFAGHVADSDLLPLYNMCSLFVFPSLAEGFGLPVLEAMSCGTPTICSDRTSLPEVIGLAAAQFNPESPRDIARVMQRALQDESFRAELRNSHLHQARDFSWSKSAMRAVTALEELARKVRPLPAAAADPRSQAQRLIASLASIPALPGLSGSVLHSSAMLLAANAEQANFIQAGKHAVSDLKLGWVSTWNTKCGIASYSEFLLQHLHADVTVFAPHATNTITADGGNVVRCWETGGGSLEQIRDEVRARRIQAVVIQFNYGFFEFPSLRRLLDGLNADGVRTIVALHSTTDPGPDKKLSYLAATFSDCHRVMAHHMADIRRLRDIGVGANIAFIPQGVLEVEPARVPFAANGRVVVASYGFALPGKGLGQLVEAFSLLVKDRPSIALHLLLLNAQYPADVSAGLVEKLRQQIHALGLAERCTFIPDYLPDAESVGYLQQADCVVYAYQRTGESSSAAVRMAISASRPVLVTPLAIFDDLGDAVQRLEGITPTHIAKGLAAFVDALPASKEAATQANLWRASHAHSAVSRHLHWVLLGHCAPMYVDGFPPDFDLNRSAPLVFDAAGSELKTIVGLKSAAGLHTTGRSGNLMHGPFISVAPGQYEVKLEGELATTDGERPVLDIAARGGTLVLAQSPLQPGSKLIGSVRFDVPSQGFSDLEVRIHVDASSEATIRSVELAPVQT